MRAQRGFTLIEVLVAAAVLATTATALFGLFSSSLFNLRKVEDLHRYELAAQDVMNRVLLLSQLPPQGEAQGTLGKIGAEWKVTVNPWAPTNFDKKPDVAILKVNVDISWPGRLGRRSIEFEALKPVKVAYSNYDLRRALEDIIPN